MNNQTLKYKNCSTCKRRLPTGHFSRNNKKRADGTPRGDGYRSNCKECARSTKSAWYYEHKEETQGRNKSRRQRLLTYVRQAKSGPCTDCGGVFHHHVMDFDHVRGVKEASVSELVVAYASIERIQREIEKCDLVCANCHRVRTWNRANPNDQIK